MGFVRGRFRFRVSGWTETLAGRFLLVSIRAAVAVDVVGAGCPWALGATRFVVLALPVGMSLLPGVC
jgi:hypothetical protein